MIAELSWYAIGHSYPGESVSGDQYLVKKIHDGYLLAVVDALGHGFEANYAADVAVACLDNHCDLSVNELFDFCHEHLKSTRGVVLSLAKINVHSQLLIWAGVGNVEGVLKSSEHSFRVNFLPLRSGIVGYKLPRLSISKIDLVYGDILIFATDGIDPTCISNFTIVGLPKQIASNIVARCWKKKDDVLVLVARFQGREGVL